LTTMADGIKTPTIQESDGMTLGKGPVTPRGKGRQWGRPARSCTKD
jgi:hypothetical protein